MFNWLKGLFIKKKEAEEEPIKIDRTVHDLDVGYILDYNMESWEVLASYTYRYKGHVAKEYKIRSSGTTHFLNVSDSNSLLLSISTEANINNVDATLRSSVLSDQPIVRLTWQNENYTLKESAQGQFTDDRLQDWASFSSWEYVNVDNSKFVYVSRWEDGSVECFVGDYLKEYHISNILAST
ncbi:MAG: DUF4178 domain-containing protein [Aureispira sp.]